MLLCKGLPPLSYPLGMSLFCGHETQGLQNLFTLPKLEINFEVILGNNLLPHQLHDRGHGASRCNGIQPHLSADHVGHTDDGQIGNTAIQTKGPNGQIGGRHPFSLEQRIIRIGLFDTSDGAGKTPPTSQGKCVF